MHKAEGMAEKKKKKQGNDICKHTGAFWETQWCQIHISAHLPSKQTSIIFGFSGHWTKKKANWF